MNESKILRTACDEKWYAHAYSEYLADVAQTVSNLMAAIQEALSYDELNEELASTILESHGINPQSRFIIGQYGDVTALELTIGSWNDTELPDGYVNTHPYSVEEAFSIIRGSWTQCVIGSKAFEAYSNSVDDSVKRVTKFIQDIQANFPIDDSVRDTVSYYQSVITASPNVEVFVNHFIEEAGIDRADESNDPMSYVNSKIYQYTGNTPGMALDFDTVNKAVASTVSVAAKTVKGIFKLVGRGVSWLFNKAKKYVIDTVIDPAVCEYISNDDDNEGYIDGFAWYGEFTPNTQYSLFQTGAQISDVFADFYDDYAEKWIKLKLKVGEFLFRIVENTNKWQCYFKPVAIDVDYFAANYTGSTIEPTYNRSTHQQSIDNYNSWLESVMEFIQPLSKEATKDQIYRGLALSSALVGSIAMFAFVETFSLVYGSNGVDIANSQSYLTDISEFYTFEPVLESNYVTNKKILLAAAGNPTNVNNINYYPSWNRLTGISLYSSESYSIRTVMTNIISIWAMCRNERKLYPANYTFVPYSNNHTSFSPASWRIKSDNEIAETRDNFIELAIVAVVVITALVFVGAAAIKISKNAFFKRQETLGTLENKMWSGQKLTPSERKKYIRYNRRQNASKWLSSGMSEPTASLSNDSQSLINLIQG